HYLPDEKYSYPSQFLTDNIIKTIKKLGLDYNIGTSWTTDAPYRETTKEIEQYKREDVLTVEMEASAVFSVAKCLNVEAAAIFTISDYISDMEWKPLFFQTGKHLQTLFQIAIETLNNI
ncbi:MAG: purine phosphorylase, partial [Candidatus Thorarchaeota archaeon]